MFYENFEKPVASTDHNKMRRANQVVKVAQIANTEKYKSPAAKAIGAKILSTSGLTRTDVGKLIGALFYSCGAFADTEAAKASMLLQSLFEEKKIAD